MRPYNFSLMLTKPGNLEKAIAYGFATAVDNALVTCEKIISLVKEFGRQAIDKIFTQQPTSRTPEAKD